MTLPQPLSLDKVTSLVLSVWLLSTCAPIHILMGPQDLVVVLNRSHFLSKEVSKPGFSCVSLKRVPVGKKGQSIYTVDLGMLWRQHVSIWHNQSKPLSVACNHKDHTT